MRNNKPCPWVPATHARVATAIRRRAVLIAAIESGVPRYKAADRAGVSDRTARRYLSPQWRPGA
jgi:hypothetical protein